jgi:hypothetical protein
LNSLYPHAKAQSTQRKAKKKRLSGNEEPEASSESEAKAGEARIPEFPPDWDEDRVKEVIAYYENQSEEEQLAEHEAALAGETHSMMLVPTELVPEVRKLIEKQTRGASSAKSQQRRGHRHQ